MEIHSMVTWYNSAIPHMESNAVFDGYGMGRVNEVWLPCYLVLLSVDSKNR